MNGTLKCSKIRHAKPEIAGTPYGFLLILLFRFCLHVGVEESQCGHSPELQQRLVAFPYSSNQGDKLLLVRVLLLLLAVVGAAAAAASLFEIHCLE
eukprot:3252287-Amphidinium_carterae.1